MSANYSEEYQFYLKWCFEHHMDNTPSRWVAFVGGRNSVNTDDLRAEIQKLKQDREKLVEALSRYANKDMWRRGFAGTPDVPWFNVAVESSEDTEWFEDEHRHVSGGIARQALKEIGE